MLPSDDLHLFFPDIASQLQLEEGRDHSVSEAGSGERAQLLCLRAARNCCQTQLQHPSEALQAF